MVVLGNEQGAGVVHPIEGKIVGLGPNLVEIDAEFQPGNSGSPIIHKASGKVIGVATYLVIEQATPFSSTAGEEGKKKQEKGGNDNNQGGEVRRFGYRLDSIEKWQSVNWQRFNAEAATMEKIKTLTTDLIDVIHDINVHNGRITVAAHQNPALAADVERLAEAEHNKRMSRSDFMEVAQSFMLTMRYLCRADDAAGLRLTYDYFRREFDEEKPAREGLYKDFDQAVNTLRN